MGAVTVGGGGSGTAVLSQTAGSSTCFQSGFTIADNAGYADGVIITGSCSALFAGGLWMGTGSVSTHTGVSVYNSSSIALTGGTVSLQSGTGVANVVDVANGSSFMVDSGVTNISFLMHGSGGSTLLVERGSSFVCRTTGYIYFGPSGVNQTAAIFAATGSSVSLVGTGDIGVEGTYSATVWSYADSTIFWDKQKTSSSTPTGRRYNANFCSSIEVDGGGQYLIPGSTDGTTNNYSYYG
jgi:hypothetical protein